MRWLRFRMTMGSSQSSSVGRQTGLLYQDDLANLMGFSKGEEPFTAMSKSVEAQYRPQWDGSSHSLYIYSGIVDYQVVGDTMAPLLRVVCPEHSQVGADGQRKVYKAVLRSSEIELHRHNRHSDTYYKRTFLSFLERYSSSC